MTIHAPRSAAYAWRCTHPDCHEARAGYASETAAAHAETHHREQANHPTPAATR